MVNDIYILKEIHVFLLIIEMIFLTIDTIKLRCVYAFPSSGTHSRSHFLVRPTVGFRQ